MVGGGDPFWHVIYSTFVDLLYNGLVLRSRRRHNPSVERSARLAQLNGERRWLVDLSTCTTPPTSSHKVQKDKIINNHTCIQIATFPAFSSINEARNNSRKLDKSHVSSVRDGHSFVKRIVNVWNSLPDCIVHV